MRFGVSAVSAGQQLMHSTAGEAIIKIPAASASSRTIGGTGRRQGRKRFKPAAFASAISFRTTSRSSG